jgi:hypothetical protein
MDTADSSVQCNVHVHSDQPVRVHTYGAEEHGQTWVTVTLPPDVILFFADLATLDGLIVAAMTARSWLAEELAGQSTLPLDASGRLNPYLTLGPLPVGLS